MKIFEKIARQSATLVFAKAATPHTFWALKRISFAELVSASECIACANCKAGVPHVSSS